MCLVSLEVIQFAAGSAEKVLDHWKFDEADLEHIIQIENKHDSGNLSFSIKARGEGALQIIALHQRLSRGSHGFFLPGGERYVTSEREGDIWRMAIGDRYRIDLQHIGIYIPAWR